MTSRERRILSWAHVDNRIASNTSFRDPVAGSPDADLFYDAYRGELGVSIESESELLPSIEPSSFSVEIFRGSKNSLVIRNLEPRLNREFYDFCVDILDGAQIGGLDPSRAVDAAWSSWMRLLDSKSVLSDEKQLGLLGELWLLQRVSESHGWTTALDSWHEDTNSEHDFCLPNFDIEVKTTTSENREHIISSLNQLSPVPGRRLYLLSIQFTRAASGTADAFSLADTIHSIQAKLAPLELLNLFNDRIQAVGCKTEHIRHYGKLYLQRSAPRLMMVDEYFPRLTPALLQTLGDSISTRVRGVQYRINVDGLGYEDDSEEFLQLLP